MEEIVTGMEYNIRYADMHIVFIVEGSPEIGMGHVVRSLALAERLAQYAPITFITGSETTVRKKIASHGFQVIPYDNYETTLKQLVPTIVVIDKMDVQESLARFIRHDLGARLCIFGNISAANQYAHVVVNAVIGTGTQNAKYRDAVTGTIYLKGLAYTVLRKEFYQQQGSYKYHSELSSILLLFGGADPANLTCATLRVLLGDVDINKITICLGVAYPYENEVRCILASEPTKVNNISILRDADSIAQIMLEHDILLTSFGVTLLEAFSLEVPVVAFFQNAFQRSMTTDFPMVYDYSQITNLRAFIHQKHKDYNDYLDFIRPLRVGTGVDEIVSLIIGRDRT